MLALTMSEIGVGYFSDWLIKKLNVKRTRQLLVFLGALGCSGCFLWINFIGCNVTFAMILLNSSMLFLGFYCVNVQSNVLDFGSQFSVRINAISNTLSNSAGFVAPLISGIIFENLGQSRRTWGYVYLVTTETCLACAKFFTIFMSAKNVYVTEPATKSQKEREYFV